MKTPLILTQLTLRYPHGHVFLKGHYRYLLEALAEISHEQSTGLHFHLLNLPAVNLPDIVSHNPHFLDGIPRIKNLEGKILDAIGAEGRLDMEYFHHLTCSSTHCVGGWAIHLAGKKGKALEFTIGSELAAAAIFWVNAGYVPDFFTSEDNAINDLRAHATKDLFPFPEA